MECRYDLKTSCTEKQPNNHLTEHPLSIHIDDALMQKILRASTLIRLENIDHH